MPSPFAILPVPTWDQVGLWIAILFAVVVAASIVFRTAVWVKDLLCGYFVTKAEYKRDQESRSLRLQVEAEQDRKFEALFNKFIDAMKHHRK